MAYSMSFSLLFMLMMFVVHTNEVVLCKEEVQKPYVKVVSGNNFNDEHSNMADAEAYILVFAPNIKDPEERRNLSISQLDDLLQANVFLLKVGFVEDVKDIDAVYNSVIALNSEYESSDVPYAVVFPYGSGSKLFYTPVDSLETGKSVALDSIDDLTVPLQDFGHFEIFVTQSLGEKKIPVLLFTSKTETPAAFRVFAHMFDDEFSFATFLNPDNELVSSYRIEKLPFLALALPQSEEVRVEQAKNIKLNLLPYDVKTNGPMKVAYIERWLRIAAKQFGIADKKTLPIDLPQPSTIANQEEWFQKCSSDSKALCIVAVLNGSSNATVERSEYLEILRHVQEDIGSRTMRFMWVDGVCNSEFLYDLGISHDSVPSLVILNPFQLKISFYEKGFTRVELGNYMKSVLNGTVDMKPFSAMPILVERNCEEVHIEAVQAQDIGEADFNIKEFLSDVYAADDMRREVMDEVERNLKLREAEANSKKKSKKGKKKGKKKNNSGATVKTEL